MSGDDKVEEQNQDAVKTLLSELDRFTHVKSSGKFDMWRNVSLDVIEQFFNEFRGHHGSHWFAKGPNGSLRITDSFENVPGKDAWDIVFVNSGKGPKHSFSDELSVSTSIRNKMGLGNAGNIRVDRRRVATGNDVLGALSVDDRASLKARSSSEVGDNRSAQTKALSIIEHPILMIYVLHAEDPMVPEDTDLKAVPQDLKRIAVTIAFPKMTHEQIVGASKDLKTYQVNQVYWRAYNGYVEHDGDDFYEEEVI